MDDRPLRSRTFFIGEGYALYVGPLLPNALHSHHAAQIVLAPHGLELGDTEGSSVVACAAIPARMRHGHGAAERAALLFLDGDSQAARRLELSGTRHRHGWQRPAPIGELPERMSRAAAHELVERITRALDLELRASPRHRAVRRMCKLLAQDERASLAALAHRAGLSSRQMRHAFVRDVGLTMRAYLRWLYLRRAVEAIEAGASVTTAAIAAGFADGAHLSRVFRFHFGISPTQALASLRD